LFRIFRDFSIFKKGTVRQSVGRANAHHYTKFHQNRSNSCGYIAFKGFRNGGCPPSLNCGAHFGTTHKEYLVVFTTMQNLVEIAAVVWINRKFEYFGILPVWL